MKGVLFLSIILCLFLVSSSFAQDVVIMYDPALVTLGVNDPAGFAQLLVQELQSVGLSAEIVDSKGLAAYMEANPTGIMLVCQGIMPGTIFKNEGADDLIYSWLRNGGIGGFVGDYPFYYWDNTNNAPAGAGQAGVFGMTLTNGSTANVSPTALGEQYIPSLQNEWTTNRPVGLGVLGSGGFEFESYADDGTNADPIAYQAPDMEGWFINFHTSCCGTSVPPNEQMAREYGELIGNRFSEDLDKSVEPDGKTSTLWGRLKNIY